MTVSSTVCREEKESSGLPFVCRVSMLLNHPVRYSYVFLSFFEAFVEGKKREKDIRSARRVKDVFSFCMLRLAASPD
jgi:hypothetical protein